LLFGQIYYLISLKGKETLGVVYPAIHWVLQALYLEGKSGRGVGLTTRLQHVS
jgi:hypothetical protein